MNTDILSETLRLVRLRGALYFRVSGTREWVAEAPASSEIAAAVMPGSEHVMEFHVVVSGACWGAAIGDEPKPLRCGDIILFPHGDAHVISSAPLRRRIQQATSSGNGSPSPSRCTWMRERFAPASWPPDLA